MFGRIQVGAPKGVNRYARNETTGVVFRCGIKTFCDFVPMNPIVYGKNSNEFENKIVIENFFLCCYFFFLFRRQS